jgi:hypothetical protein
MNDFLSGYNFARQSDVVFSETIPENNSHRTYIVDKFELNDNDIIFCKTDNVLKLFEVLNDESEIKNIKLITHESDYPINESVFKLKPNCISKWYGINVNYKNKDLIPLPLGLANDYCPITLKINQLKREQTPEKLLYINHRIHNNIEDREWLYNFFETNNWCTVDVPDLSLDLYKKRLDMHKFILCPKGNGIDTHRLWESLYHGIIPIVESHVHYDCLEYLPALVVASFKEITKEFLELKFDSIKKSNYNLDKLKVSWWIEQIKNEVF